MIAKSFKKLVPQGVTNRFWHYPKAVAANIKHGFPSSGMVVIGVSGTDGKTTTTNMIYQILKSAGKRVSVISTLGAVIATKDYDNSKEYDTGFHVTTLSPGHLQKYFSLAKKGGSEYVVLEVTSQGIDQFRVLGVKFQIGVITNITQDHFDYHKNFENYFKTKAKLIKNVKVAIINKDEEHFLRLKSRAKGKVVTFGMHKTADFNPIKFPLKLSIPGEYNLYNALAASAVGIQLGIDSKVIKQALSEFSSLKGRMEEIKNDLGFKIIVDFAHTPNALEQALKTLKKQTNKNLIAVFGSAGDRDKLKRPLMGKAVSKYADKIVLTAEDPRFEDTNKIIAEIALGINQEKELIREPDRQKAISMAIKMAQKGDIVGIFGKGHEKSMTYKEIETPWSEHEAVEKALHERG